MVSSEIGLGGMSAGVSFGNVDIYGKSAMAPESVHALINGVQKFAGLTHTR